MKITDDMLDVFASEWHRVNQTPSHAPGARRRAGLEAVLAMPEVRQGILADMTDWELEQASAARRAASE